MKLLIVDDEKKIVDFLVYAIDWQSFGYADIKTFTSSKEAILKIDSGFFPDLLITDIRMPEVSGLDLVQKVEGKSQSIIISGYSDFEYAQQAIRFGVFDYLLKPIFPDELEKTIKKVTNEFSAEKFTEGISQTGFYLALLSGQIVEKPKYLQILKRLMDSKYYPGIVDFGAKSVMKFTWNHKTYGFTLNNKIVEREFSNVQRMFFKQVFNLSVVNIQIDNDEFLTEVVERRWNHLIHRLNGPSYKNDNPKNILFKLSIIQSLFENQPILFEKLSVADVLNLCYKNQLMNFLYSALDHDLKKIEDSNQTVLAVQNYISKNLSAPLSVEWLADKVHIHPVYLSRLYKQETGENLSQYILNRRLQKMKELLLSSNLKVKTITELVGYRKTQNIIGAFKRKYGLTPSQYRKIYTK